MNVGIPKHGNEGAARFDLSSMVDITILAYSHGIVKIGLAIKVLKNTYERIAPKSGIFCKEVH